MEQKTGKNTMKLHEKHERNTKKPYETIIVTSTKRITLNRFRIVNKIKQSPCKHLHLHCKVHSIG